MWQQLYKTKYIFIMIACLKERNKNVSCWAGIQEINFYLQGFFSSLLNNHFLDNRNYIINSIKVSIGSVLPVEIIWNNSNTVQRLITSRSKKEAIVNRLQCFWFVAKVRIWWSQTPKWRRYKREWEDKTGSVTSVGKGKRSLSLWMNNHINRRQIDKRKLNLISCAQEPHIHESQRQKGGRGL